MTWRHLVAPKWLRRFLLGAGMAARVLGALPAFAQSNASGPLGLPATGNAGYPPGATPQFSACTAADTAGFSCNLPSGGGVAGKITYVCGLEIAGLGATAATNVQPVLTMPGAGSSLSFQYTMPVGATVPATPIFRTFWPCLPTVTVGSAINLNVPGAAGNTFTLINIWGYTQ